MFFELAELELKIKESKSLCLLDTRNIVQLFELSTVNDSIQIKRNDISKKVTKNEKIENFEKYQKKSSLR